MRKTNLGIIRLTEKDYRAIFKEVPAVRGIPDFEEDFIVKVPNVSFLAKYEDGELKVTVNTADSFAIVQNGKEGVRIMKTLLKENETMIKRNTKAFLKEVG
jgi:hypothetical protein